MFVTKGEFFVNTPTTTYWLPEYFNQLPAQQLVATAATFLTTAFAADPALESTGPYANGDCLHICISEALQRDSGANIGICTC